MAKAVGPGLGEGETDSCLVGVRELSGVVEANVYVEDGRQALLNRGDEGWVFPWDECAEGPVERFVVHRIQDGDERRLLFLRNGPKGIASFCLMAKCRTTHRESVLPSKSGWSVLFHVVDSRQIRSLPLAWLLFKNLARRIPSRSTRFLQMRPESCIEMITL